MTYGLNDDRTMITLAMPSYVPRARGIHAKGKFGHMWRIRCSELEKELLQEAADELGLHVAEFIRWLAISAAMEVLRNVPEPEPVEAG